MKRVLIVDDAAFMRMSLRKIMVENGFEVVGEAENGKEALEKYNELQPDIVTLDITMPEMDGITALKGLMKLDPNANVVIVSAMGQESYVREAVMAGAKNFIVKPFNKDHVIKVLNSL
ncbi:MAG TPA: response regulator [Firmicutes bacterium]|uniref:Response regulator n=1 Tax=Capillibacterium thermochitinicola TaxID=2699427 RepID=A0A8J6I0N3_9FIRM|nr:response regulator [Capillibacterium thermochitinicola]MBA2133570.1 response regulator [Capillibacterium thermochitinicola]HHW11967.1 response regulator [Bacillota bacterium]